MPDVFTTFLKRLVVSGLMPGLITTKGIGAASAARRADAARTPAAPDWLSSPLQLGMLQLGMTEGRDYIAGTAIGAPAVVVVNSGVGSRSP
jgi:hypothetical protein